jgi:hypothetical protein
MSAIQRVLNRHQWKPFNPLIQSRAEDEGFTVLEPNDQRVIFQLLWQNGLKWT